jgi:hypothetical protein
MKKLVLDGKKIRSVLMRKIKVRKYKIDGTKTRLEYLPLSSIILCTAEFQIDYFPCCYVSKNHKNENESVKLLHNL